MSRTTRQLRLPWLCTLALSVPAMAASNTLLEQMPADSAVCVGWSHVLTPTESTVLDVIPKLVAEFGQDIPHAEAIRDCLTVLRQAGEAEGAAALFLSGGKPGRPYGLCAVVESPHAKDWDQTLTDVAQKNGAPLENVTQDGVEFRRLGDKTRPGVVWTVLNGRFLLASDVATAMHVRSALRGESATLARDKRYETVAGQIVHHDSATLSVFVDFPAIVGALAVGPTGKGIAASAPTTQTLLEDLGINGLGLAVGEIGPSPHGLYTQVFVETKTPRRGVLALWDNSPLTADDLACLPEDTYWAAEGKLNLAAAWHDADRILANVWPQAHAHVLEGIAAIDSLFGISLVENVLPAFGDTWILYDSADHGGVLFTGIVLVVDVRDADALRTAFRHIIASAAAATEKATEHSPISVQITTDHRTIDGHDIDYVVVAGVPMPLSPAACFVDNRVVCGLTPQSVALAAAQADPNTRQASLLDEPDVREVYDALPDKLVSFFYHNGHVAARTGYGLEQLIRIALASMMAPKSGDPGQVPTLPEVLKDTHDSLSGWASESGGLRYIGYGSFAPTLTQGQTLATIGLMSSVMLPSLARARLIAKRAASATNLKAIGEAIRVYKKKNGKMPPSLDALVSDGLLAQDRLTSPLQSRAKPYIYIAGQSPDAYPMNVLVYERPASDEGTTVLFVDGHIEFVPMPRFEQLLYGTYQRLDRLDELPEVLRPHPE